MPTVSVIIPAYNAERHLAHTLASVTAQTYMDWEAVVVDDGSRDSTREVATGFSRSDERIRYLYQPNGGVANARNAGFSAISSDSQYVVFLDHDDMLAPDAMAVLLKALAGQPDAPAAYGLARYVDSAGAPTRIGELERAQKKRIGFVDGRLIPWPMKEPTTFEVAVVWPCIVTPGQAVIRRASLAGAPFLQRVAPADDMYLWMRLALAGPILLFNQVVLDYRWHDRNVSRDLRLMQSAARRARRELVLHSDMPPAKRTTVKGAYRAVQRHLCVQRWADAADFLQRGSLPPAAGRIFSGLCELARSARPTP